MTDYSIEAPVAANAIPTRRRWVRIAAVSGLFLLLLGVGAVFAAGYVKESKTIDQLRQQRTHLTRANAGLTAKLAATTQRANKTTAALGAVSKQLATTKNDLATTKKKAAQETVNAYSNGYSTGNSAGYSQGSNDASASGYDSGYSAGYDAGYSAGLCIDPTDNSYVC
jgi:type VI protein secretion system component VasK